MSIKEEIIEKLNATEDPAVLNSVLSLLSSETEREEVYTFTPEEREMVLEGIKELDNGLFHTQKKKNEIMKKWFEEQDKSFGLQDQ